MYGTVIGKNTKFMTNIYTWIFLDVDSLIFVRHSDIKLKEKSAKIWERVTTKSNLYPLEDPQNDMSQKISMNELLHKTID